MDIEPIAFHDSMPRLLLKILDGDLDAMQQRLDDIFKDPDGLDIVKERCEGPNLNFIQETTAFDRGARPNNYPYIIYHEHTLLVSAVKSGKLDMVKLVVDSGANVNMAQVSYTEPNEPNCCMTLEECEEAARFSSVTPLGAALINGNFEIATFLLDHGADVTCLTKYPRLYLRGNDGHTIEGPASYTTLNLALRWDAPADFLQRLIEHGVDLHHCAEFQTQDLDDEAWLCGLISGWCVLWIPCLIGALLSEDCHANTFRYFASTAEQQAKALGNEEALVMIRAGLSRKEDVFAQEEGSAAVAASAAISPYLCPSNQPL